MTRHVTVAILFLALTALACGQQIGTPTPAPTPTRPAASATIPVPAATGTPSAVATVEEAERATVRAAMVNVRSEPNGEVVGQLIAGTDVRVIGCDADWCEVEADDISGFVFVGCLSIADGKGCIAK